MQLLLILTVVLVALFIVKQLTKRTPPSTSEIAHKSQGLPHLALPDSDLECRRCLLSQIASETKLGALSSAVDADVSARTISKKIALVTGGRGFVGTGVVSQLQKSGMFDEVRVFDILGPKDGEKSNVNWIQGDMLKMEDVLKAVDGVDSVVHLAAIVDMRYADLSSHQSFSFTISTLSSIRADLLCLRFARKPLRFSFVF